MSDEEYVVFGKPHFSEAEIGAVLAAFRGGWVGTGPRTKEFEREFSKYIGTTRAVAVGSCTAALHLSMLAGGLQPGDEVITTPLTFAASANSILHAGATPVFADIDPVTQNIDPAKVEEKITPRTRAILAVHLTGRPCDMDALTALARKHNLMLFEDAAHAIEAVYKGRHIGTIGDAASFSFYVTKNISTIEGGMLCTSNQELASKAATLALHGMTADAWNRFSDSGYKHYEVVAAGFKYNMTDVQAALGLGQLTHVDEWLKRRNVVWKLYDEAFADLPCVLPAPEENDTVHARHLYTLLIDQRDDFLMQMHARRIGTGVHYRSLHSQPFYREKFGHKAEDFPHAQSVGDRTVSIPLTQHLTDGQVSRVITAVREILSKRTR
jgi:dTDP-4-amino-4,6-dideoxygalactose transaminase